MTQTILTNAHIILEKDEIIGTIVFDESGIIAVDEGRSSLPQATDVEGDYIAPGLIEMHTDNMEKHFMPRPGVFWPNGVSAALAHDAQMAAAGVTTVYDSICAGSIAGEKDFRRHIFAHVIDAVTEGTRHDMFRIDHRIHIRCELTGDELIGDITPYIDHPLVQLASLMDHTPGMRQWRNLDDLKRYNMGSGEKSEAEHEAGVKSLIAKGPENRAQNWPLVVDMCKERGILLATHDDTTEDDVDAGVRSGAVISEFPTTVVAAQAAKKHGLGTIAGAPNVVRGGSHSGGVSAAHLAEQGLLDGLSSDYVPASLMQAIIRLHQHHRMSMPDAMAMVTWKVADMLKLTDRGHLKPGLRSDLIQFRVLGDTPVIRSVWSAGQRAH
jgi:alpha-D-ribose 1-methylphosphonate 5-triphosphate diphosphatase